MPTYPTLREANAARQSEWANNTPVSLAFRANELAGEAGEACNVIKKLERQRLGLRGTRATLAQLAEELADVVICADLLALGADVDLLSGTDLPFGPSDGSEWGTYLALQVGKACLSALYRVSDDLDLRCRDVERTARAIAAHYSVDLDAAIVRKFNVTSAQRDLDTRMSAPAIEAAS